MDVVRRADRAVDELRRRWGHAAVGAWAAPGRVNVIGEHTDYNDGLVLPVALDREVVVAVAPRPDGVVRTWSAQLGEAAVDIDDVPHRRLGWHAHVAGVAWVLRDTGLPLEGADLVVDSDVPVGAGLSSSAALECAVALALADLSGHPVDRLALALAAQRAEREVVGTPVGVMDHVVAMLARAGSALFLDCRTLATDLVPLHVPGCTLVVIDTAVAHHHASGGYARRRAECEEAAALIGVASLRDATAADVATLPDVLRRRARHVVSENARVLATVDAMRSGDVVRVGRLLVESHASLRDDFEVSVPALDVAVDAALRGGALGARLTGGGFGGSVVALVPDEAVEAVGREVLVALRADRASGPTAFAVRAADGARRITRP